MPDVTVEVPVGVLALTGLEPRYLEVPKILVPTADDRTWALRFEDDFNRTNEQLEVSDDWDRQGSIVSIISNTIRCKTSGTYPSARCIADEADAVQAEFFNSSDKRFGNLAIRGWQEENGLPADDASNTGYQAFIDGPSSSSNVIKLKKGRSGRTLATSLVFTWTGTAGPFRMETIDEGGDVRILVYTDGILRLDFLDTDNPLPRGGFAGWGNNHDTDGSPTNSNTYTDFKIYGYQDTGLKLRTFVPSTDQSGATVEVPLAAPGVSTRTFLDTFNRANETLQSSPDWTKLEGTEDWDVTDGQLVGTGELGVTYELTNKVTGYRGLRWRGYFNGNFEIGLASASGDYAIFANGYRIRFVQGGANLWCSVQLWRNGVNLLTGTIPMPVNETIEIHFVDVAVENDPTSVAGKQVRFDFYSGGRLVESATDAVPLPTLRTDPITIRNISSVDLSFTEIALVVDNAGLGLSGHAPHFAGEYTSSVPTGALTLTGLVPTVRDSDKLIKVPTAGQLNSSADASDTFTRSDEALDADGNWEEVQTGLQLEIISNVVGHSVDNATFGAYTVPTSVFAFDNQRQAVDFKSTTNPGAGTTEGIGACLLTNGSQSLSLLVDLAGFDATVSDGTTTITDLFQPVAALTATDVVRLEVVAGQVRVYLNGAEQTQFAFTTSLVGGQPGLCGALTANGSPRLDDWNAYSYEPGIKITGLAPIVLAGPTVDVPVGTLTFTGLAPIVDLTDNQLIKVPLAGGLGEVFSDDFNRADEDLDADSNWTSIIGPGTPKWILASNEITLNSSGLNTHAVEIPESVRNYQDVQGAEATITALGSGMGFSNSTTFGVGCRMTATRGIAWGWSSDGTRVRLISVFNGTEQGAKSISPALAVGDSIRLEIDDQNQAFGYVRRSGSEVWDLEASWLTDLVVAGHIDEGAGQPGAYHNMADLSVSAFGAIDDFAALDSGVLGLNIVGLVPTVDIQANDVVVEVPVGSLTLTGLAPVAGVDRIVNVPVATLSLTGLAPQPKLSTDEEMSWVAEPGLGALALAGLAPTLRHDYDVPTGALTFTGLVPSVDNPAGVEVPTGSIAFTGLVPDVDNPAGAQVPVGSLTLTGLVPTVEQDVVENVPVGSLTLTGLAPTVEFDITVNVPVGALSLVGFAPFMRPVVPTGTLTLTGLEPVVITGDDQTVLVPLGALSLTGLVPTAVTPNTIDVPVGSLTLAGLAPEALTPRLVDVPTGSLAFTGLVPDVLNPAGTEVPVGSLSLAGLAPTVLNPAGAEVPVGALTLTGQVPTILNSITVPVPAGSLSLTGLVPTVEQDVVENIPTGTLTLTGLQPIAINPQGMIVPTGALTLTGLAPSAPISIVVPIPAGALTLTGLTPTVEQDVVENIPTGSLAITGLVPVIDLTDHIVVDVPVGSLSVAGLQPTALTPRTVDVPVGSISIAGLAPTIDISAAPLIVPTGTLTLTGFAPNVDISADIVVEVPTGAIVITGYPPILFGQAALVPTGALVLTGLAPRIQFARDYSRQLTFKRVYRAWTDGGEGRVFKVDPDEGTDIQ